MIVSAASMMHIIRFDFLMVHPHFSLIQEKGTAEAIPPPDTAGAVAFLTSGSMKNTLYETDALAQSDE